MKPLSDSARSILQAAQRVETPSAELSARTWSAITARAAAGDLGPALSSKSPTMVGTAVASKPFALVAAGIAGATALVVATAVWLGSDDERASIATPGLAIEVQPSQETTVAPEEEMAAPEPEPDELEPEVTIEITEPDEPEVERAMASRKSQKPRPQSSGADASAPEPTGGPNLGPEVALMAEARAALGAGDPALAVELFEKHARRFPRGVFARERDVSWIVALCAVGREDEAKRRAKTFLDRHGKSALADRVRRSCGGQSLK